MNKHQTYNEADRSVGPTVAVKSAGSVFSPSTSGWIASPSIGEGSIQLLLDGFFTFPSRHGRDGGNSGLRNEK
jgi:hypothetical protein